MVTLEILDPKKMTTGSSGGPGRISNSIIEVSNGKSLFDAIQNFSNINSSIMDFSHTKVIILSKQLCESGISEVIDYVNRDYQFRNTDWILVANNTAREIVESEMYNEDFTTKGIDDMMNKFDKNPSIMPVNIKDYIIKSELNQNQVLFL